MSAIESSSAHNNSPVSESKPNKWNSENVTSTFLVGKLISRGEQKAGFSSFALLVQISSPENLFRATTFFSLFPGAKYTFSPSTNNDCAKPNLVFTPAKSFIIFVDHTLLPSETLKHTISPIGEHTYTKSSITVGVDRDPGKFTTHELSYSDFHNKFPFKSKANK